MNGLVEALKKAQENRCIESDKELADLLGISPSTWSKIKSGDREIGHDVISRILVKLPELTKDAMAYLKEKGTKT